MNMMYKIVVNLFHNLATRKERKQVKKEFGRDWVHDIYLNKEVDVEISKSPGGLKFVIDDYIVDLPYNQLARLYLTLKKYIY